MRLIDADFTVYAAESEFDEEDASKIRWLISHIPTVDAEPARHGRWLETDYFDAHKVPIYQCSNCFREVADHYIKCHKYCLHCGAKMDLED